MQAQTFILLPEWHITQTGKSLIISGGADARYEIDLDSDQPSFFADQAPGKSFTRKPLCLSDQRALEELITSEVVVPKLATPKVLKVVLVGDKSQLELPQSTTSKADFLVVVRTNSTYADLLASIDYANIDKPHLFVDMAFHHTLSIGPLVFPGETACIACLQGRLTSRWGDETPPQKPQVIIKYEKIINELVSSELQRIAGGDTSLTNKTVSWNFQDRLTRQDQLLKVPVCPICSKNAIDQAGALALPWSTNESISNPV